MDYIKVLGASGSLSVNKGTTCLQLAHNILIDGGNIINSLGDSASEIEHIFITHSHFDHIADIPSILDLFITSKNRTLHLYGLPETLHILKTSLFNQYIFPDFSEIDLADGSGKTIEYHEVEFYRNYTVDNVTVMPFPTNHTVASCGYVVTKGSNAIMFTSDTGASKEIYDIVNNNTNIKTLITETSFPNDYESYASVSLHLTPKMLCGELKQITRDKFRVLIMHMKPRFSDIIADEIEKCASSIPNLTIDVLFDGDIVPYGDMKVKPSSRSIYRHFNTLLKTGIALTSEHSQSRLSELILKSARDLTQSDAGTLYLLDDNEKYLNFNSIQNDSIDFREKDGNKILPWAPIPLFGEDGEENHTLVAAHCALTKKLIRIDDIYDPATKFDFHSTLLYDEKSGYRSHSMLLIPLIDYENNLIGVLQLINKLDTSGETIPYNEEDEQVIYALGSQATISITNQKLKNDFEMLFESFLKTINLSLDKKSSHMQGHINKVLKLTMLIVNGINNDQGIFADKTFSENELKTMELAAMMHDIGKIITPIHIMDKAKKLETIFDRIELIRLRAEILKKQTMSNNSQGTSFVGNDEIESAIMFLEEANLGHEYFDDEKIKRIKEISEWRVKIADQTLPLITEDELKNLIVKKGTLTEEQRDIINYHANMSKEMLGAIQFPKKYSSVPEIAGNHHEKINGTGYPAGLKGDEISFEARILAIADIFEALTSSDRLYKENIKLSEAVEILWDMANSNDIDRNICKFFYDSGIYLKYAREFMEPEYVDKVEFDFSF